MKKITAITFYILALCGVIYALFNVRGFDLEIISIFSATAFAGLGLYCSSNNTRRTWGWRVTFLSLGALTIFYGILSWVNPYIIIFDSYESGNVMGVDEVRVKGSFFIFAGIASIATSFLDRVFTSQKKL